MTPFGLTTRRLTLPLLFLLLMLPGCLGVLWIGDTESPVKISGRLDKVKRSNFDRMWGVPVVGSDSFGQEVRTYTLKHWRWHGLILWPIIPIPIMVPFGHERYTATFDGEKFKSATYLEGTIRWGGMCGLFWHPHSREDSGFHCGGGLERRQAP
jgi:hypothetical protein